MRLKEYLDDNGVSTEQFARRAGISASAVYKYRTGARRKPSPSTIMKIQKLTGGRVKLRDWV
jgi:transcriptional regulator with XRE-family HTH domain